MRETKAQRIANFYKFAERYGLDMETADKLRRIEMTLHRWAEAECNGEIQRPDSLCGHSEDQRADCLRNHPKLANPAPRRYYGRNMEYSYPIADREDGALKRLAKIMEGLPHLVAYHQGDPRGCALYVIPKDKIGDGEDLSAIYNQGFAICY